MEEPLIYREEVTAVLIVESHHDETVRNFRELAAGGAEREWRAKRAAAG